MIPCCIKREWKASSFSDDEPNAVRVLSITEVDVPVEIEPPDIEPSL